MAFSVLLSSCFLMGHEALSIHPVGMSSQNKRFLRNRILRDVLAFSFMPGKLISY